MVADEEENARRQYGDASARWGVPLNFAIKEFHLYDVLSQLAELAPQSGLKIVFKGGTALNKIYFDEPLQRFSEDLDFDDYSAGSREQRIGKLEEMACKIKGYSVGKGWRFRKVLRIECGYVLPSGQKDHVRIEFALQTPDPKVKPVMAMAKFGIANASLAGVPTYSFEDLLARKMIALSERDEGKDVYDVALGLQKADTKKLVAALGKALRAEGRKQRPVTATTDAFLEACRERLEELDSGRIGKLANPYIPVQNRPKSWKELIETLIQKFDGLKKGKKRKTA